MPLPDFDTLEEVKPAGPDFDSLEPVGGEYTTPATAVLPPGFTQPNRQIFDLTGRFSTTRGGPPIPVADYAETMASIQSDVETPLSRLVAPRVSPTEPRMELPKIPIPKEASFLGAMAREAVNAVEGIPEFFTSDAGILSALTARLNPRLVSAGFSVDLLRSAWLQAKQTYENWGKMTPAEKGKSTVDVLTSLFMGGLTGTHAAGVRLPSILPTRPAPMQGPSIEGRLLPTPQGAVPSPAAQAVGAVGERGVEVSGEPTTVLSPETEATLQEALRQKPGAPPPEEPPPAPEAVPKPPAPVPTAPASATTKPEVATLGTSKDLNSLGDPIGTKYHATPEDWAEWQRVQARWKELMKAGDIESSELPALTAANERIKNRYGENVPVAPKEAAPAAPVAAGPFRPGESVTVRDPASGREMKGEYRGAGEGGRAVVEINGVETEFPEEWLRREGGAPAVPQGTQAADESVALETTDSIAARTKVGTERDTAFSQRAQAGKRVAKSLKPGDVIIDEDGVRRTVDQVMKDGTIFVKEGAGEYHLEPGMKVERAPAPSAETSVTGAAPVWLSQIPKSAKPLSEGAEPGNGLIRQLWDSYQRGNEKAGLLLGPETGSLHLTLAPIRELIRLYPSKLREAIAADKPAPAPAVPPEAKGKDYLRNLLAKEAKRIISEEEGQNILNEAEDAGRTPDQIAKDFFENVYPNLDLAAKRRIDAFLKASSGGFEPGKPIGTKPGPGGIRVPWVAETWMDIIPGSMDANTIEQLQGSSRGLVSVMEYGNKNWRGLKQAKVSEPAQLTEGKPAPAKPATPVVAWHGTKSNQPIESFGEGWVFSSKSKENAATYGNPIQVEVVSQKPVVYDAKGGSFEDVPWKDLYARYSSEQGDSIRIDNVVDTGSLRTRDRMPTTVWVTRETGTRPKPAETPVAGAAKEPVASALNSMRQQATALQAAIDRDTGNPRLTQLQGERIQKLEQWKARIAKEEKRLAKAQPSGPPPAAEAKPTAEPVKGTAAGEQMSLLREQGITEANASALIAGTKSPKDVVDSQLGLQDTGPDRHIQARWLAKTTAINKINEILGKPERYTAEELYGKKAQAKELAEFEKDLEDQESADEGGIPQLRSERPGWVTIPNLERMIAKDERMISDPDFAKKDAAKRRVSYESAVAFAKDRLPELRKTLVELREESGIKPAKGLSAEESARLKELQTMADANKKLTPAQRKQGDALLAKAGQKPPEQGPGMVGMGGAAAGEVQATGPRGEPVPTYGPSARMLEARRQRGVIAPVEPGQGVAVEEAINRGRELLQQGANPERIMADMERTKRFNADEASVLRAHGERLEQAAYAAADQYGPLSEQYEKAWEADSDWSRRFKALATEWHKVGQGLQGETEIDTGTFHGLRKAFFDKYGKDFDPKQAETATRLAKQSKGKTDAADAAETKLLKQADAQTLDPKVKSLADRIIASLDKAADDALARIRARRLRGAAFAGGIDPAELDDYAIYGAAKFAKGAIKFTRWSAEMATEIGDFIKPHLRQIWAAADRKLDATVDRLSAPPETKAAVKRAIKRTPTTPEEARKALADYKPGTKMTPQQGKALWALVKGYLERGETNANDVRNKLATDLGLPLKDVTQGLTQSQPVKRLADDMWRKQVEARQVKEQAKRWLYTTSLPGYRRALAAVPRILFTARVSFHGTVPLGTHAPMVAFQPTFWATYVRNFGQMYRMVGSPAYYGMQIADLPRRANYMTARRAGLINDPAIYEDYTSPLLRQYFGKMTGMGVRGFTVLKILRQDMFDHYWDALPESSRVPGLADEIARAVNHSTGVTQWRAPKGVALALFAPRLEASRVAWLFGDPVRAADIFIRWKNATPGEKWFATHQLKEKLWVLGTMYGLLKLNQGVINATGSDQQINFTNPFRSDFLKFKAAGMDFSYGNAMVSMARLPVRLWVGIENEGKLNKIIYEDENTAKTLWDFTRSQASPFASLTLDLAIGRDYQERPLPRAGFGFLPGKWNMPKRLRAQGTVPYTWSEFWTYQALPIPAQEAAREVWRHGFGMTDEQIKGQLKALATISIMAATGARLNDDTAPRQKP